MSKNTRNKLIDVIGCAVIGGFWGLLLGWIFEAATVGGIVGALTVASIGLINRVCFARPIAALTPFPSPGPRPRTKVERAIEPFLCAIIGAAYGGIFYILGGRSLSGCLLNGAVLFFFVDFFYLRFLDQETAPRG